MQNTTTATSKYERLIITGEVSIEPVPANEKLGRSCWIYLIVGPTGAGKSSFIEAFSGSTQKLEISKDQLAGYTQRVQAYHLINVSWNSDSGPCPIYIIDTPGFSDTQISETQVIDMLHAWLDENSRTWFDRILFLTPITQPRLAGSKRRTIAMLNAFLNPPRDLGAMTFVTTMWDQVHDKQAEQRAEAHFAQLGDVLLNDLGDVRGSVTRFTNTKDSALQVLNTSRGVNVSVFSRGIFDMGAVSYLYHDLHERIESALQMKRSLELDLATPYAQGNLELQSILQKNHADNEETLRNFVGQLVGFGEIPGEYEHAVQDLRRRIAGEVTPVDYQQAKVFRSWAQKPEGLGETHKSLQGEPLASLHKSHIESPVLPPQPRRLLALKGLIQRLINVAKRRGKKWFKRRT